MEELRHLDEVAYVRFASVYRSFRDVEAFRGRSSGCAIGAAATVAPAGLLGASPLPPPGGEARGPGTSREAGAEAVAGRGACPK